MSSENESDILAPIAEEEVPAELTPPEEAQLRADEIASTDEFLQEELNNTEAMVQEATEVAPEPIVQEVPTVSLQIEMLHANQREKLKEMFSNWNLAWEPSFPRTIIPRLQEAEAVQLMQWLNAAGFLVKAAMQWPQVEPVFSETPPEPAHLAEGAPAVSLPDSANGVLLLSTEHLPQLTQVQSLGLVSAHKSLSRRFFKQEDLQQEVERELKKMHRSPTVQYASSSLAKIFRELCSELQRQALTMGANAVIGIQLQSHTEEEHRDPSLDQIRLIAIGTASIVEK